MKSKQARRSRGGGARALFVLLAFLGVGIFGTLQLKEKCLDLDGHSSISLITAGTIPRVEADFHPSIKRDFAPWGEIGIKEPTSKLCELVIIRYNTSILYLRDDILPPSLDNKARALDTQLAWVSARIHPATRTTSQCFKLGSTPVLPSHRHADHPVYSLAKSDRHLDIVYPNMYFGYGGSLDAWAEFQDELRRSMQHRPFEQRFNKAFWRGTCGEYKHNQARVAVVLASNSTTLLAVWFKNRCPASADPAVNQIIDRVNMQPLQNFVRPSDMTQYKYLLSLPGSSKGSYSRHMQTALCCNSTTFLWDNEYYEYYYSMLKPWVHYVPVNNDNFMERIKWAEEHQEDAMRIAMQGYEFCVSQLSTPAFLVYWMQLFAMHGKLQRYEVELTDGMCSCEDSTPVAGRIFRRCRFCDG